MDREFDVVNCPEHYTSGKYECLKVMEDVYGVEFVKNFCIGNSFKYIWRHNRKNGVEDLKKAKFYIEHAIDLIENRFDAPSSNDDELPFK